MNDAEFIEHLEEVFDLADPGTIKLETRLDAIPGWDSISILHIANMANDHYGVTLSAAEIRDAENAMKLRKLIENKAA